MNDKRFFRCLQLLVCLLVALQCHVAFGSGENLPPAKFKVPAPDAAAQKYLGLKAAEPFALQDTNAKLMIVEFFSALCPQCHANAPVENRIYKVLQEDPGLSDVKLIGIAVATEKPQLEAYRKNFKVPFPLFIDENFAISASMEGVETPTTMIIDTASGKVLASHTGVIKDFDGFLKELRANHKKK